VKHILLILAIAGMLSSCGSSTESKAMEDQKEALKITAETLDQNRIPAKEGEWTMTAKIDGKEWNATSFFPLDFQDRIHGFYKEEESISLPYDKRQMKVGGKIIFGEDHVALLFPTGDEVIWDGKKGEMEITKVDKGWAEGKFFFTAITSTTSKPKEVTDGFFRIAIGK
jgi:hypothetical protein